MKTCKACGKSLDRLEFPKDGRRPGGLHPYCKRCKCAAEKRRRDGTTRAEARPLVRCRCCKQLLPRDEFAATKSHTSKYAKDVTSLCRTCKAGEVDRARATKKAYYAKNKQKILSYSSRRGYQIAKSKQWSHVRGALITRRGGECAACGLALSDVFPPCCFDFHHINPATKISSVANLIRVNCYGRKKTVEDIVARIAPEADKCTILCAVCHRKIHKEFSDE